MLKQFLIILNLFKLYVLAQLLLFTKWSAIADLLDALTTFTDLFTLLLILQNSSILF